MEKTTTPHSAESLACGCTVAGWGTCHADTEELESLRQLTRVGEHPIPPGLLRHADEQTVAGIVAIQRVLEQGHLPRDFRSWGVLGCLHTPGRTIFGASLNRFAEEGAWGVSPHVIPHRCLHSLSGTVSLILKCEGPNFGVGEPEAILPLAMAWLSRQRVPGIWVILSWVESRLPTQHNSVMVPGEVVAGSLALALQPDQPDGRCRLALRPTRAVASAPWGIRRLESWLAGLNSEDWILPGGFQVERIGMTASSYPGPLRSRPALQETYR